MIGPAVRSAGISSLAQDDLDTSRWVVVIPSFNHADDAIICLESLRKAVATPAKVVLVDDASTDNAVHRIAAWGRSSGIPFDVVSPEELGARKNSSSWLTIVSSKTNSGFSVSCNIGLRFVRDHTDAPFAFLINNDAAVSPSYFSDLAAGIANAPNTGLATGTIYEWDQRTVWYAGGRFNPLRAVAEHFLEVPSNGAARTTEFVCGCTMLISRAVLQTVGLLPECYAPCYCEDADYSLMAQRAGFALTYVPNAKAFHRVGSSLGRKTQSPQVIYWFNRNRGYAMRRNFSGWRRAGGIAYLVVTKPTRALWEVLHGRPRSGAAFIRGTLAGFFNPIGNDP
jgi:GT2 family glycosyltransferase